LRANLDKAAAESWAVVSALPREIKPLLGCVSVKARIATRYGRFSEALYGSRSLILGHTGDGRIAAEDGLRSLLDLRKVDRPMLQAAAGGACDDHQPRRAEIGKRGVRRVEVLNSSHGSADGVGQARIISHRPRAMNRRLGADGTIPRRSGSAELAGVSRRVSPSAGRGARLPRESRSFCGCGGHRYPWDIREDFIEKG